MTHYIVTEKQIVEAVEFGIKQNIQNKEIVDAIMRDVIEELETVLMDDCDTVTDEMWNAMMV